MSFAPAQVVESIARQPLPYGLFSVLVPRSTADPHWQNGITWETLSCAPVSGYGDVECASPTTGTGLPKNLEVGGGEWGEAEPFGVYGSYQCTPTGHTVQYAQDRATEHLLSREEARVEQAIWTGDLGNAGFAAGATSVTAAAVPIARAIAALEGWLGRVYGSLGVIHMTREAAILAASQDVVVVRGNQFFTELGTPIVAGAGYPGTGPAGEAPSAGDQYLYATPALLGYRSEVFSGASPTSAGFDREENTLSAVAERTYVVGWDPCGTAVALADLEA